MLKFGIRVSRRIGTLACFFFVAGGSGEVGSDRERSLRFVDGGKADSFFGLHVNDHHNNS